MADVRSRPEHRRSTSRHSRAEPQSGPERSELVEGGVSPARSARHPVLESYLPNIWRFMDQCATSAGHTAIRAVRRSRVPMPYDGHGVF